MNLTYLTLGLSIVAIGLSIMFYLLLKSRIDKATTNIRKIAVDLNKVEDDEHRTWDGK